MGVMVRKGNYPLWWKLKRILLGMYADGRMTQLEAEYLPTSAGAADGGLERSAFLRHVEVVVRTTMGMCLAD